jgi:hypothetical protein
MSLLLGMLVLTFMFGAEEFYAQVCMDPATGAIIPCPSNDTDEEETNGEDCADLNNNAVCDDEESDDTPSDPRIRYIGEDGNWFNPENWTGGIVPGPEDDVVIAGSSDVIFDPARGPNPLLKFRDLFLFDAARVTTLPGTIIEFRDMLNNSTALPTFQSTLLIGRFLAFDMGMELNPSALIADYLEVTSGAVRMFLGGTQPAGPDGVGQGHYANIRSQTIFLNSPSLQVELIYDFQPKDGDVFIIVEAEVSLFGVFDGLIDGSLVQQFDEVGLFISYDENRIQLQARLME